MSAGPHIVKIDSLDDPRIAAYTRLKERDLAREGGRFIAEGELVVRRLLASRYAAESLLLAEKKLEGLAPLAPGGITIYAASAELVNRIVGFKFHSGAMAIGIRGQSPSIDHLATQWEGATGGLPARVPSENTGSKLPVARGQGVTLVICPEIANTDNMGALIRIASGFGADAMILGERCCDPFYRQSIRVSMGTIFRLPLVRSANILQDMNTLRSRHGFELIASVLADDAEPLASARRSNRVAVLFGNEAQGLRREEIAACDRRITIPMSLGTDSLNVSVSAGIFLYHFTQAIFRHVSV